MLAWISQLGDEEAIPVRGQSHSRGAVRMPLLQPLASSCEDLKPEVLPIAYDQAIVSEHLDPVRAAELAFVCTRLAERGDVIPGRVESVDAGVAVSVGDE
jgi:hypothetical protein